MAGWIVWQLLDEQSKRNVFTIMRELGIDRWVPPLAVDIDPREIKVAMEAPRGEYAAFIGGKK